MRKALKITGIVLGSMVLLLFVAKFIADATYFNNYDPSLAFNTNVLEVTDVDKMGEVFGIERPQRFQRMKLQFQSRPGEMIPTLIHWPLDRKGKVPVIVFMHGIGQKKEFIGEISTPFNEAGFAMACFDQIMQGERKVKGALAQAVAFRQRPWRTINDARRLIDYLCTHPDIDSERIYLVGASYGAITGCTVVAKEERIRAAIMVVGGGNINVLLDAPLIKGEVAKAAHPIVHTLVKPIVRYIMAPADPINYASNTSPTPVLFQNGSQDTLVSPEAGKELFKAAGEPKEIRWYPCDHPGLKREEGPIIVQILDEGLEWLLDQDKPFRDGATPPGDATGELRAAA